mgnify:CR=1 FL=1
MADPASRVEVTAGFLEQLEFIEAFLQQADALLAELKNTVIPNLRQFPRMGRRYLEHPPRSAEAIARLRQLPAGAGDHLRVLVSHDHLILYSADGQGGAVYLLSIRHHRQLGFDIGRLCPGGGPGQAE